MTIFGGVGMYAVIFNWKRDYRRSMYFDNQTREFRLQSAVTRQADFTRAYNEVDRLHIFRTYRGSAGSDTATRHAVYILAIVLRDGSELNVDQSGNATNIEGLARSIADFAGFGVTSQSELAISVVAPPSSAPATGNESARRAALSSSKFVRESITQDGRELRLLTGRMSRGAKIVNTIVLGLFFAAPLLIFSQPLLEMINTTDGGDMFAGDIIFMVFAGLFIFAFYSVVILVILMQLKTYSLIINRSRMLVRIEFRAPFFRRLNQEIEIPASQIGGVQINLSEEGHFWLALSVGPDFQLPMVSQFLANVGPYARGIRTGGADDQRRRISLWDINAFQSSHKDVASTADLEYIADLIRETYR